MNDNDLKCRLNRVELSTPGVGLDHVMRLAEEEAGRRRNPGLLRMALAVAGAWLMVFVVQSAVERSIREVAPGPGISMADGSSGQIEGSPLRATLIGQRKLVEALLADDAGWPTVPEEQGEEPARRGTAGERRGDESMERQHCARRGRYV